jgi:uncharacterized membrane protein YccC
VLQPLRANLTWSSANLRHAVRATVVALPALAVTAWSRQGGAGDPASPPPPARSSGPDSLAPIRTRSRMRHAVRATVVALPALAVTAWWPGPFTHWLTITVVLTMHSSARCQVAA